MHLLVLEDGPGRLAALEQRRCRSVFDIRHRERVQYCGVAGRAETLHARAIGPGGAFVTRRFVHAGRIDPALEESLQLGVDRRAAERLANKLVEAERRNMTLVENDRVAQGNRTLVIRRWHRNGKELGAAIAVLEITPAQEGAIEAEAGRCQHSSDIPQKHPFVISGRSQTPPYERYSRRPSRPPSRPKPDSL